MGYIYLLVDKRNGKKYVGKHNNNKKDYWSSGILPNRIAKKYGRDIFNRYILEDNIPNRLLNDKEIFYINKENSFLDGYNSTKGGDGGGDWILNKSKEELEKISDIKSKKMSGRIFSELTISKMKESGKKKKLTDEHKKNISIAVRKRGGFPHSEETKVKLSKLKKGTKNDPHSSFMKKNNPNFCKISVNEIIYNSIKEYSIIHNISYNTVKNRLNSTSKKFENWFRLKPKKESH
jgi:hypothetical protein